MKRGVPPTARKARTGELTPPGMTRWARSNSAALVVGLVDTAAGSLGARRRRPAASASAAAASSPSSAGGRPRRSGRARRCPCPGGSPRPGSGRGRPAPRRRRPAARCRRPAARPARRPACRRRRRSAASKRSNFSPVSAPCGDASTLSMNCSLPLDGQHHAGDQHEARAVLAGGHRQLARRGRALAVPVGQQEVGQRLVVAHQHFGGRQDQLAEGVQVGLCWSSSSQLSGGM